MTNVSKKKLSSKDYDALKKQIVSLFAATNRNTASALFYELFSEAEQIMFLKRVAVVALLQKGVSRYKISQALKVSESTVAHINLNYEQGNFAGVKRLLQSKQFNTDKFWQTLEIILQAGMPPMGRGRWQGLVNTPVNRSK